MDWKPVRVTPDGGEPEEWEYKCVGGKVLVRRQGWSQSVAIPVVNPHDDAEHFSVAVTHVLEQLEM